MLFKPRVFVHLEPLEPRRLLSDVLIDQGFPSDPADGFEPALQIGARWTSTASGGTGALGTGVTVTWSIVPDGTAVSAGLGEPALASDLQSRLNALYGSPLEWMPMVQQAFDGWSNISGVTFVQDNDDGVTEDGSNTGVLGVRGDVRIGAHPINGVSGTIAYNWYPDRGDMVIDSADLHDGGILTNLSNNSRLLKNTMAHELGHALGLNHVNPRNGTKLMEALLAGGFDGPQFDELYSINRNYGDRFEKSAGNNSAATAVDRGTIGGMTDALDNLSLATTSDVDFYKFTIDSTRNAVITIAPFGPTYDEGPDPGSASTFVASAQMDLQVQLIASNGTTVLSTVNATAVGSSEMLTMNNLAAGSYYIKVSSAPGAADRCQMYTLSNAVSGAAVTFTSAALSGGNDLLVTDTAVGGKADSLTITADNANSRFVIGDSVNFITTSIAGAGGDGTHTVTVPYASVSGGHVFASLLGGNDVVSVTGGAMPITIDAGAGTDTINVIETPSGVPVTISPSSGDDTININADGAGVAQAMFPLTQTIGTLTVGAGGLATTQGVSGGASEVLVIKKCLQLTGGKLDMKNNDLALTFYAGSSPIGAATGADYNGVLGLIQDGRAGGAWSGNGLITTQSDAIGGLALTTLGAAEAGPILGISGATTALFDGQSVDASTVIVRYTLGGDSSLNHSISADDFFNIDAGYASGIATWLNGDFNYSGTIDVDDYFVIDWNYNKNNAVLTSLPVLAATAPMAMSYHRPMDDLTI